MTTRRSSDGERLCWDCWIRWGRGDDGLVATIARAMTSGATLPYLRRCTPSACHHHLPFSLPMYCLESSAHGRREKRRREKGEESTDRWVPRVIGSNE
uniref:Uncharacterized protein n=1 Tax=Oryza barthii TaxID=65489 RepID=A0A0D3HMY0_9ORYZ